MVEKIPEKMFISKETQLWKKWSNDRMISDSEITKREKILNRTLPGRVAA